MNRFAVAFVVLPLGLCLPMAAQAHMICTVVADTADGHVLVREGDCATRVTPASTFKVALAVMGYGAGLLKDAHAPIYDYRPGDPDWGGDLWKQPTDPTRWLKYSVVWYSQRVTHQLGEARLAAYASRFGYGNADFAGDPGKANGLDRAWIMSSLQISPDEQVTFLRKLVERQLPVSLDAMEKTAAIVEITPAADGWESHGKTGAAFPRKPDGSFDEQHGYGWYVGWLTKGDRTLVFARLDQDDGPAPGTPGVRARDAFLAAWPTLAR